MRRPNTEDPQPGRWIHFWLFGPEFGCVKRALPIVHRLGSDAHVLLIVHRALVHSLRQYFQNSNVRVMAYPHGIRLMYDAHLNLNLFQSMVNIARFLAYEWIGDFSVFRRAVKTHPPGVIVTDFLPYIPLWAKLYRIPCIGVYNYGLAYTSFGRGVRNRVLEWLVNRVYRLAYRLPDRMFVESIVDRKVPNATCIPIIRRDWETGCRQGTAGRYFLALGGNSDPTHLLDFFRRVQACAPQLSFSIAPRFDGEWMAADGVFNVVRPANPFSIRDVILQSDGIISKAGFSTVAEALQFQKKLFVLMLDNHPEIQETATTLFDLGLAKPLSLSMSPEAVAKALTADFDPVQPVAFGGEVEVVAMIQKQMQGAGRPARDR